MRTIIVSILFIGVLASVFVLPFSEMIKTGEGKNSLKIRAYNNFGGTTQ